MRGTGGLGPPPTAVRDRTDGGPRCGFWVAGCASGPGWTQGWSQRGALEVGEAGTALPLVGRASPLRQQTVAAKGGGTHHPHVSRWLLLLDDDAMFRALVAPALRTQGFEVVEAAKGREALEKLTEHDFDLLIVDGLLPDTNGIRWIEKIRAEGADAPIVFVSAFYRDLATYKKLKDELKVADVVHKPVEPASFAVRVTQHARRVRKRRERKSSTLELDFAEIEELLEDEGGDAQMDDFVVVPDVDEPASEEKLRESYSDVLPHILDLFLRAVDRARRRPDNASSVEEAIRQSHDIAGTAGSFGYAEIGHCASVVESQLRALQNRDAVDWDGFDRAVAAVRALPIRKKTKIEPPSSLFQPSAPPPVPPSARTSPEITLPRSSQRELPVSALDPADSVFLGPRMAIIDDDPALLEYVEGVLADSLATFVPCSSFAAIETLKGVDVAIIGMPFGSPDRSTDTIAALRSRFPGIPTALLAMEDSLLVRLGAAESGAQLFLSHPLDEQGLARAVLRLDALRPDARRVVVVNAPPVADALASSGLDVVQLNGPESLLSVMKRQQPHVVVLGGGAEAFAKVVRMADGGDQVALLVQTQNNLDADGMLGEPSEWAARIRQHADHVLARRRRAPDPVTGLPSRGELLRALAARLSETRRRAHAFSLAVLEVDDHDGMRTREGSAFTERVTNGVARLLAARLRVEDVRGRWRHGMLVAAFADATATEIATTLQRVQQEVKGLGFQGRKGRVHTTLSIGVASAPEDAESLGDLTLVAEGRLRVAQRGGPGKLVWTG